MWARTAPGSLRSVTTPEATRPSRSNTRQARGTPLRRTSPHSSGKAWVSTHLPASPRVSSVSSSMMRWRWWMKVRCAPTQRRSRRHRMSARRSGGTFRGRCWSSGRAGLLAKRAVARHEAGREGVPRGDVREAREPHLLHEPVLQGAVGPLDAALRPGLEFAPPDLDLPLGERPAETSVMPRPLRASRSATRKTVLLCEKAAERPWAFECPSSASKPAKGLSEGTDRIGIGALVASPTNAGSVQGGAFAIGLEPMAPRWLTLEPAVLGATGPHELAQPLAPQAGPVQAGGRCRRGAGAGGGPVQAAALRPERPRTVRRRPAARAVSRETFSPWRSASFSAASVGPRSASCSRTGVQGAVPHAVAGRRVGRPPAPGAGPPRRPRSGTASAAAAPGAGRRPSPPRPRSPGSSSRPRPATAPPPGPARARSSPPIPRATSASSIRGGKRDASALLRWDSSTRRSQVEAS